MKPTIAYSSPITDCAALKHALLVFDKLKVGDLGFVLRPRSSQTPEEESLAADYQFLIENGVVGELPNHSTDDHHYPVLEDQELFAQNQDDLRMFSCLMKHSWEASFIYDQTFAVGNEKFLDKLIEDVVDRFACSREGSSSVASFMDRGRYEVRRSGLACYLRACVLHASVAGDHNAVLFDSGEDYYHRVFLERYQDVFEHYGVRTSSQNHPSLELCLKGLPTIRADVPLDEILAFRKESENVSFYRRLRLWASEAARGNICPEEILDRIAIGLEDYARYMGDLAQKRRLEYCGFLLSFVLEFIENLIRLKPSASISKVIEYQKRMIDLGASESNAPFKELAYFQRVKERFGQRS